MCHGLRGAGLGFIMQADCTGVVSLRLLFATSSELALLWLMSIPKSRGRSKVVNHAIEVLGYPSDRRRAP